MKTHFTPLKRFCLIGASTLLFFFASWGLLAAQTTTGLIYLVTDKPVYLNGETVTLSWYINTEVQNCVVTGPDLSLPVTPSIITSAALPVEGTYSYVPPDDSVTSFNLNCEKYTPVVVVPVVPSVTVRIDGQNSNITKYFDEDLGGAPSTVISWTSSNATRCSNVIYRTAIATNVWTEWMTVDIAGDVDYSNRGGTSGWVRFDGDPRLITETTQFAVGCYNDNEDPVTSRWNTKQVTLNVIPPEPPPITINLWSPDYPRVTADVVSGYAAATVDWRVYNADGCSEWASTLDGTRITVPGWDFGSTQFSGPRITYLSTTTKFTLSCWRNERVYNGVSTYPATSTLKELIIEVVNPFGGSMEEWDRSDPLVVPPVTVSATATPNPTYKDPLTGKAATAVSIDVDNASYCYLYAYADNDGDGVYTNGYTLTGWTRAAVSNRLSGNYTGTINVTELTFSTRLRIDCIREFDLNGTTEEQDNGREEFNLIVEVLSPDEPAPEPEVYLYSNAVRMIANDIWATSTNVSGFQGVAGTIPKSYLYGAPGAGLVNSISFPFAHPYGEANAYDVWLQYCDNVVPDGRIGIALTTDDSDYVYFNGAYLGTSNSWNELKYYTPPLRPGLNVIAVKGVDTGGYAGFLAAMKWAGGSVVSGADWKISTTEESGWNSLAFDDSGWTNATTHGLYGVAPWYGGVSGFLSGTGAQWIWTPNNNNGDRELYIRYSFYVDPSDLTGDGTARVHKLYDKEGILVGTHVLPGVIAPISCAAAPHNRARIASSFIIRNQDTITLECKNGSDEDTCPINRLHFGAGNNANVLARMDPVTERATVQMLWISENTTSCSSFRAYNLTTGASYNWYTSTGYTAGFPAALSISTSTRFTISCSRSSDNLTSSSEVTVNVPFQSIYSITTLVFSGQCIDDGTFGGFGVIDAPPGYGPEPGTGYCKPLVDLAAVSPSVSLPNDVNINSSDDGVDNMNGTYDLPVLMAIQNKMYGDSGAALPENSAISYMASMTIMAAHGFPTPLKTDIGYFNGSLDAPTAEGQPVQSGTLTRNFNDVPFGTHRLCSRVNLDSSPNYAEANPDPLNNTQCTTINLPVPVPPMTIDADRKLIRRDQPVTIDWRVNVTYQLLCSVRGPGGLNASFDTSLVGAGYTNSFTTTPLTSAGIYELECTEPITGTSFMEQVRVEMVPDVQEI